MAHPVIPPARPRSLMIAGLAGTLLLSAGPAAALTIITDEVEDACRSLDGAAGVLDPACGLVEDTTGAVVDAVEPAAAPVTEPVEELLAPVAEVLPEEVAPLIGGEPPAEEAGGGAGGAEAPAPPAGPATGGSSTGGTTPHPQPEGQQGGGDGQIEAAGKDPVEVIEPQGPTADGRIAGGPTLQPTDLSALGGNIAGISSESGLTLQPYDAPLVSVPMAMDVEMPQVAGAPITTASPVAALAAEAMTFTGDVVLPQTGAEAAMVTATGLGLLVGGAYVMRRKVGGMLSLDALDER